MRLTRPEAVTLALYALGGGGTPIDTEDVAIRAAEIAPGMFAWRKYPDNIDKDLVRVSLHHAKNEKKWVVGSHSRGGWLLTTSGQQYARTNEALIGAPREITRSGREQQQHERERARLLTSAAFLRLSEGVDLNAITADEADAFFRINVYVEGQARERKIARVENQFGNDSELATAIRDLAAIARGRTRR